MFLLTKVYGYCKITVYKLSIGVKMEESFSNITLLLVFLLLILLFIIVDIFMGGNKKNYVSQNSDNSDVDFRELQRQEKINKRLRAMYWDYLPNIYDSKSTKVLEQARAHLEQMQNLHNSGVYSEQNNHNIDLWYYEIAQLRRVLNNPQWLDSETNTYHEIPLFVDLDIQYINDEISERNRRPKRTYNN